MKRQYLFVLCTLIFALIGSYAWHTYQSDTSLPSNVQVLQAGHTSTLLSPSDTNFIPTPQREDNKEIWKIAKRVSKKIQDTKRVSITFKDNFEVKNLNTFFSDYQNVFGLGNNDEMRLIQDEQYRW